MNAHKLIYLMQLLVVMFVVGACSKEIQSERTLTGAETGQGNGGSSEDDADVTLSGLSAGSSVSDNNLALDVNANGISAYKFKIGLASDTDCSDESSYSDEADVTTQLTADISSLSNGLLVICIITKSNNGKWQDTSNAKSIKFTKDTEPPAISGDTSAVVAGTYTPNLTVSESATYSWTKVSGPGTASFSNASALSPTVTFGTNGTYVIKLTATDSAGNSSSHSITVEYDSAAPPALAGTGDAQGTTFGQINLTLTLPADVSDYSVIRVHRSSGAVASGVAAPAGCSGDIAAIVTDFSSSPINITDFADTASYYYSYRVCIYDAAGNVTSSDTMIDAQAGAGPGYNRFYAAYNYEDDGGASGDISTDTTTSVWDDLMNNTNGTLTNFTLTDANSGWYGTGIPSDPYRLSFDGADDYVAMGAFNSYGFSFWFKSNQTTWSTTGKSMAYSTDNYVAVSHWKNLIYTRWNTVSVGNVHRVPFYNADSQWHHYVVANTSSARSHYIDGVRYVNGDTAISASKTFNLGANNTGADPWDGSMAEFRSFSGNTVNENNAYQMYASTRHLYKNDPNDLVVERVSRSFVAASGGDIITVIGWGMAGVSSVTIGGTNAPKVEKIADAYLRITAPAKAAGKYDLVITDGTTTKTLTNAVTYTGITVPSQSSSFDAANVDTLGRTAANAANANVWKDHQSSRDGIMYNFSYPGTASSGWQGNGSKSSPYRLIFDGSNDYVQLGSFRNSKAISVWFKIKDMSSTGYLFSTAEAGSVVTYCFVNSGTLTCRYNDTVGSSSTAVSTGTWYHLVISHITGDNDAKFYLNNSLFSTDTSALAASTAGDDLFLGAQSEGGTNPFNGEIMMFQQHNVQLDAAHVDILYNEGLSRIQ